MAFHEGSQRGEILYFFNTRQSSFFFQKQSQKSRSVLQDRSRSLRLFRKGKTRIIAKFQETYSVICCHSLEGKARLIAE